MERWQGVSMLVEVELLGWWVPSEPAERRGREVFRAMAGCDRF